MSERSVKALPPTRAPRRGCGRDGCTCVVRDVACDPLAAGVDVDFDFDGDGDGDGGDDGGRPCARARGSLLVGAGDGRCTGALGASCCPLCVVVVVVVVAVEDAVVAVEDAVAVVDVAVPECLVLKLSCVSWTRGSERGGGVMGGVVDSRACC